MDDGGDPNVDFCPADLIRWERIAVDIGALESEQDLLDTLHARVEMVLDSADGLSMVARVMLTGRGELSRSLRRANALRDLREGINDS